MADIAAWAFLIVTMGAGLVLLVWRRPWDAIPPIDTDEEGRPTDDYPTAQAWWEAGRALRALGREVVETLRIPQLVGWLSRRLNRG